MNILGPQLVAALLMTNHASDPRSEAIKRASQALENSDMQMFQFWMLVADHVSHMVIKI